MSAPSILRAPQRLYPDKYAYPQDFFRPIIEASPARPYVVAQLGQSLDGRIATPSGASRTINRDAALDHLHRLRAHVDAVVVGINTVTIDDPLLTVRRVPGKQPARVIIDPNGRLPLRARCLKDDGAPCIVIRKNETHAVPRRAETLVVEAAEAGEFSPHDIVASLFVRGFKRILVEGGASTVSAFIDAGAVDRLHVLVAPVIIGSGVQGLNLAPIVQMHEAKRPQTRVQVLDDGDVLFDCDLRSHS
jgi:riboflavin-specific deaminase-like protein